MVDGQLELLQGERVITISAGDLVFLPRGTTHRRLDEQLLSLLTKYDCALPPA